MHGLSAGRAAIAGEAFAHCTAARHSVGQEGTAEIGAALIRCPNRSASPGTSVVDGVWSFVE